MTTAETFLNLWIAVCDELDQWGGDSETEAEQIRNYRLDTPLIAPLLHALWNRPDDWVGEYGQLEEPNKDWVCYWGFQLCSYLDRFEAIMNRQENPLPIG